MGNGTGMIRWTVFVDDDWNYQEGTKYFQILFKHFNSSPSMSPLPLLSHPGSCRPKREKTWLAVAVSRASRVRFLASGSSRSAFNFWAVSWLANLSMFSRLDRMIGTESFWFLHRPICWLLPASRAPRRSSTVQWGQVPRPRIGSTTSSQFNLYTITAQISHIYHHTKSKLSTKIEILTSMLPADLVQTISFINSSIPIFPNHFWTSELDYPVR